MRAVRESRKRFLNYGDEIRAELERKARKLSGRAKKMIRDGPRDTIK